MFSEREYDHRKNWFKDNLTAIPGGVVGNCSACVFRNAPLYCAKMSCTYFDNESDFIETVYWRGAQTHANIATWTELRKWFDTTPPREIMNISNEVLFATVSAQKSR